MSKSSHRPQLPILLQRLREPRRFLQAIEVKTGHAGRHEGLDRFRELYPHACTLLVGPGALALDVLLARPAAAWLA